MMKKFYNIFKKALVLKSLMEAAHNHLPGLGRRYNNVKALAVQFLYIVLQLVGGKTAHGHTAIFGDIALGQGQI